MIRGRRANAGNKYREFIAAIIPKSKPSQKEKIKDVQTSSIAIQTAELNNFRKRIRNNGIEPRLSINEIETLVVHPKPKHKVMIHTADSVALESEIHNDFHNRQTMCDICGISLRRESLKHHIRTHTGERPHSCDVCGRSFTQLTAMKNHRKTHILVNSYMSLCEICGVKTLYLSQHMRKHNKSNDYMRLQCEYCLKWIRKRQLKRHKRSHTGEWPFHCRVCGKSFNCSGKVKRHEKLHTGVLEYKCDVCGKMCSQRGNLKIHMRVHTHEKPYSCDLCGELFTYSTSLSAHKKKHQ